MLVGTEEVLGRNHWGTLWSSALVGTIRSGVRLGSTEESCTKASSVWVPDVAPPTLKSMPRSRSAEKYGMLLDTWFVPSIRSEGTSPENPEASTFKIPLIIPSPVNTINLARLHGMSKVLTGKLGLMARAAVSSPEVEEVLTKVALRSATTPTPKKPTERINATS
ncbi:hypothetical protein GW17_00033519 [Ensete ventricosum]|nr:hypothetical protein GW17_00033519 [Ensete ventricosum]